MRAFRAIWASAGMLLLCAGIAWSESEGPEKKNTCAIEAFAEGWVRAWAVHFGTKWFVIEKAAEISVVRKGLACDHYILTSSAMRQVIEIIYRGQKT